MACSIDMSGKKIRLNNLAEWKAESRPWAMLTCYDYSTARKRDHFFQRDLGGGVVAVDNVCCRVADQQ